jgi:CHAT domain-containing protein
MMDLASFELYLGNFEGARTLYDSMVSMTETNALAKSQNKFKILYMYSALLSQEGDIGAADIFLGKAEEMVSSLPDQYKNSSLQRIENSKALKSFRFGDLSKANTGFLYSITLLHRAFKDGVYKGRENEYEFAKVILYKNVANNDIQAGNFSQAKIYLDSAMVTFSALEKNPNYANSPMHAALQNTLGEYYMGLGDLGYAKFYMSSRVEELERFNNRINLQMRIEARQNLANLYLKEEKYDSARIHFEKSKSYIDELKVADPVKYKYLTPIINFYQLVEDHSKADEILGSIDLEEDPIRLYYSGAGAEIITLFALKANSLANLALEDTGSLVLDFLAFNKNALSLSDQISWLVDSGLENALKKPTYFALNSYLKNLRSIYLRDSTDELAIREAIKLIDFAKNQQYAIRKKSALLWNGELDPDLYKEEKILKQQKSELEKLYLVDRETQLLDSLMSIAHELERVRSKLFNRKKNSLNQQNVNSSEINLPKLKGDQQEFYFYYSEGTLHVITRTDDSNNWTWGVKTELNLENKISKALDNFQNQMADNWQDLSKELYEILLKDYLKKDKNRLIIYPFGNIGLLPFAALINEKGNYLIEEYAISFKNGLNIQNPGPFVGVKPLEVLAFAPYFEENSQAVQRSLYGALDGTRAELIGIQKFYKTIAFEGENATKENFIKESKDSKIIHVATHAFAEANMLFSKIVFSGPQEESSHSLFGYEISEMELNAEMLILSACQTGFGKFQLGEGISSLAKLFENAGVKSLVYTLWKIDDYASANLMTFFYENLDKEMEKDLALQAAQLSYLKENRGEKDAPYYWAGYVVSGDLSAIKSSFSYIQFFIALVLVIGIVWGIKIYFFKAK